MGFYRKNAPQCTYEMPCNFTMALPSYHEQNLQLIRDAIDRQFHEEVRTGLYYADDWKLYQDALSSLKITYTDNKVTFSYTWRGKQIENSILQGWYIVWNRYNYMSYEVFSEQEFKSQFTIKTDLGDL